MILTYKKPLSWLIIILLFLSFLPFLSKTVFATTKIVTGENVVLTKDQTIEGDYFASGDNITIAGTVNGDVYVGGGKITIEGTVNGDLLAGGGTINMRGTVRDDARIGGGNITIDGSIGRNLTVGGGNIIITTGAKINRNIVVGGGNVDISNPVNGDIIAAAGQLTIGNKVNGIIQAGVGNLTLTPNAVVQDEINYWSDTAATIQPGASFSAKLTQHSLPVNYDRQKAQRNAKQFFTGIGLVFKTINFISILIIGLLFITFLPNFSQSTASTIQNRPWMSLGIGLLTLMITPIVFILLMITVLALPIGLFLLFGYLIALYITKIFVSLWLGQRLSLWMNLKWSLPISYIAGLILITVISFIPLIGGIVSFLMVLAGMGALLITKKEYYQILTNKKLL